MIMQAVFPAVDIQYSSIPYARLLDTIEERGFSRITWNEIIKGGAVTPRFTGLPDAYRINPLLNKDRLTTLMTETFQRWIYRINVDRLFRRRLSDSEFNEFYEGELNLYRLKSEAGGHTIRDFNSLFRGNGSHTNYAGVDTRANFIAQENLDEGLPMFSNIVTGRWVGKMQDWETPNLYVINYSKPYTHIIPNNDVCTRLKDAPGG